MQYVGNHIVQLGILSTEVFLQSSIRWRAIYIPKISYLAQLVRFYPLYIWLWMKKTWSKLAIVLNLSCGVECSCQSQWCLFRYYVNMWFQGVQSRIYNQPSSHRAGLEDIWFVGYNFEIVSARLGHTNWLLFYIFRCHWRQWSPYWRGTIKAIFF